MLSIVFSILAFFLHRFQSLDLLGESAELMAHSSKEFMCAVIVVPKNS